MARFHVETGGERQPGIERLRLTNQGRSLGLRTHTMTTAIVLAAGRGSRLGDLSNARPKCLLPLGNETVLDRQLRLLKHAGVERVVIVTGYRSGDIVAHVRVHREVTTLYNPLHKGTRPISSLFAAKDYLVSDTLILNGDLVFARQLIDTLI
ncbi:MAG: NTP transferase domain-containing protein, partial [Chloroflexota bacterium]